MVTEPETSGKPRTPGALTLVALFIACFLLPFAVLINVQHFLNLSQAPPGKAGKERHIFPCPLLVSSSANYIKVEGSEALIPHPGEDFLLAAWFSFQRMPALNKRHVLLSNYSGSKALREGYALAIRRDKNGIWPMVYWADSRRRGRWFDFPEVSLPIKTWVMFALSLHKDRYLGLHMGRLIPGEEVLALGGYDLGKAEYHMPPGSLLLGGPPGQVFRGVLGPLAIFAKPKLSKSLRKVLTDIYEDPLSIPKEFKSREVKLWLLDGKADKSPYGHKVLVVGNSARGGKETLPSGMKKPFLQPQATAPGAARGRIKGKK